MNTENRRLPPEGYTGTTSGHLSVILDPPAWPTPIDFPHNNPSLQVPAFEYVPTEYRGLYANHLDTFSVESPRRAVGSGTRSGSGCLSNAPVLGGLCAFNKANPRGPSEDVWCPVLRPPAGQIMSGHSSDSIGAQVGTHVPGRGIYGMHCTGNSGGGVTFSTGDRNSTK